MKYIVLTLMGLISGCAQLMSGQEQPVISKSLKDGIYYTTCSGAVENFGTCNKKAMKTCAKGYLVVDRYQDTNGSIRALTFKCN